MSDVSMNRVAREAPRVPLHASNYRPGAAIAVLVAVLAVAAAFAVLADDAGLRLMMVAVGALVAVVGVAGIVHQNAVRDRIVRIDPGIAGLRFTGPASVHVLFLAAAVVGVVPGLIALSAGVPSGSRRGGLFFLLLSGIALVWLAQQLWALRTPTGLTLTEHGLRGVRGSKPVQLGWDELDHAEAVASKGAKLALHLRTGGVVEIEPRYTGSDANVVAPVINFFLAHPEHRSTLRTPRAALQLVEEHAGAVSD
ncbi:hypothetical protein [Conyzicola nivalis]|uniref:hypothetical protein n=1 Tax=Conyzicola nivalis TaxID=1477021 RepID=UPI00166E0F2D|nr:hypothetical protein [Conyzicola nivalis]